ncbi:hypothetical protein [Flexithrix dorotheae]|uniref:hypothetical protein n=1 Tax=Flexithrix dorotheae TaxID=70993 RepID=UPI00035FA047|nr:hypothetical protein [Flexithrix dorotheae]
MRPTQIVRKPLLLLLNIIILTLIFLLSSCDGDDENVTPDGARLLLINSVNTPTKVQMFLKDQELASVTNHGVASNYVSVPPDSVITIKTNQDEFNANLGLTLNEYYSVYIREDDDDADISIFRNSFPDAGKTTFVMANMSSVSTGAVKFAFINPTTSDTLTYDDIFPGANPVLDHADVTGVNLNATADRLNLLSTYYVVILDAFDDSPIAGGTANEVFPVAADNSYSLVFAGEPGNYSIFQVNHTASR